MLKSKNLDILLRTTMTFVSAYRFFIAFDENFQV